MKLVNGEKLESGLNELMSTTDETGVYTLEEFIKAGKEPKIYRDILLEHIQDCTLSPAELADENLKALAVLEELKLRIACAKKNTNSAYQPCAYSAYDTIDRIIKELESDIGIDIDTKVREKARKWEIISDIIAVSPARETVTYGELQAFVVDEKGD